MEIRNQLFINGEWVSASNGDTFAVLNPANNEVIAQVAKATEGDIHVAAAAADEAERTVWGPMNPMERSTWLHKVGDAISNNLEFLAGVETDDVGKPIIESRAFDIAGAAATFHYFADIAVEVMGSVQPTAFNEVFDYTVHEPIGVIGAIIPWNFPFLIAARKIASSLAAGNTMVIKPSSWAPLSTILMGDLFTEAGMPAGVLNVVPCAGETAGSAFSQSPIIEEVSFTGSTEVGEGLYCACGPSLKGCTLELGGKGPGLVLPDCNIEETIAGTLFGAYLNQGECCCALTRLIVHEDVYDEVVDKFVAGSKAIKVGMPREDDTRMGPMIHKDQLDKVMDFVNSGKAEGATALCGGNVLGGELAAGNFMEATVFADVTPDMRIWREEIFGPVVVVAKASSVDEMVAMANDTPYGLAASVWTDSLKQAHTLARQINSGTVWFNLHNFVLPSAPYGGFGASGIGLELGKQGLLALTRTKNVMISLFPDGFKWY